MSEERSTFAGKHLSAKELLRNKGICSKAWNEWDESSRALPKIGANKQFEPNGSWLEKKQIEKGLKSREFLLGIERVERLSQLSIAEWLPEEKRARVTKKIGNEWSNFGKEINSNLYLIPEEALILLETECLELVWEGVPMSIQQAYEILIESEGSDCNLDEYRVYSQLTRLGYRLQRFYNEKSSSERSSGFEEPVQKKKLIVSPENGLWMTRPNVNSRGASRIRQKPEVEKDVKEIVENMIVAVNGKSETNKCSAGNDLKSGEMENAKNEKISEGRKKNTKIEIISEQTILSPIKIVKDGISTPEVNVSKWPGARIQRNVKLLPKRSDKSSTSGSSGDNQSSTTVQPKFEITERILDKRKKTELSSDSPETKKSKHEVIELSDDEIEEIPRTMSRMEMLNYLPNIASGIFITENITKRYIPHDLKARSTYRYDTRKLKNLPESDKVLRKNLDSTKNGSQKNSQKNSNKKDCVVAYNRNTPKAASPIRINNRANNFPCNLDGYHSENQYLSNSMLMNNAGSFYTQQCSFGRGGSWQTPRWSAYHMNVVRNFGIMNFAIGGIFSQRYWQENIYRNRSFENRSFYNRPQRYLVDRAWRGSHSSKSRAGTSVPKNVQSPGTSNQDNEVYQGTFVKLPGTSSWQELKQKWREAKTITIDDEESVNNCDEDNNDIEVVDQTIKPLIDAKNSRNISEIYERLRIIKSAPDKIVRRRKNALKISYNVYSSTQHYRKSNPGLPMFHLVVTSRKEDAFLQPVELNRLQQDGKGAPIIFAHVSHSSIAYIQPGIITLPNLN